jgi:hypothetical protein
VLRHIFLWKMAPGCDPEKVIRTLNELPAEIPWIRSWHIGKHHGPVRYENTWEYGMTVDFDSLEDYNRYSDHPAHKRIVPIIVPMFSARAVLDLELTEPG